MDIVVLDGYTLNPGDLSWDALAALGTLKVYDRTEPEQILARIGHAGIVLTNKTPLSRQTLEAAPGLKYIGVLATGYNVVDVAAARERGMTVTNIPTYGTDAVAQYVFALLLEVCHHVGHHSQTVQDGQWATSPDFCYWHHPLIELAGKTLGIIGLGRIGLQTARIAQAFGMKVLAFDGTPNPQFERDTLRYVPLKDLLAQADVVSLHCPLLESTREIINRDSLAQMKPGAILINTSRGPLVNESDLAAALASGHLAAAAVDVVSSEPIHADNPLLGAPNILITPHIAWAPKESRARLLEIAVGNLQAWLQGSPNNEVTR